MPRWLAWLQSREREGLQARDDRPYHQQAINTAWDPAIKIPPLHIGIVQAPTSFHKKTIDELRLDRTLPFRQQVDMPRTKPMDNVRQVKIKYTKCTMSEISSRKNHRINSISNTVSTISTINATITTRSTVTALQRLCQIPTTTKETIP